jgi:Mor family transcriptional regulator
LSLTLGNYISIFEPSGDLLHEDLGVAAKEAHKKFRYYYGNKLIFFPKGTATKIFEIDTALAATFNEFTFIAENAQRLKDSKKQSTEIINRVRKDIKAALTEMEDEFRRLLGEDM